MLPGRLTRWKGGESVIDAAARLKEMRGADFLVVMAGDDDGSGASCDGDKEGETKKRKRNLSPVAWAGRGRYTLESLT